MRRVLLLSPYKGNIRLNVAYAQRAMIDCVKRGEAPFASHLLYPQALRDSDPLQRAKGFECEAAWAYAADAFVIYTDLGISSGMERTLSGWPNTPKEYRTLGKDWYLGPPGENISSEAPIPGRSDASADRAGSGPDEGNSGPRSAPAEESGGDTERLATVEEQHGRNDSSPPSGSSAEASLARKSAT